MNPPTWLLPVVALLLAVGATPAMAQNADTSSAAPAPAAAQAQAPTPAPASTTPPEAKSPAAASATPAPSGPAYVVSYIEVGPAAAHKAAGILHRYAVQARRAAGNAGCTALREHDRPGRFALVESWKDQAALDAHAPAAKAMADAVHPLLVAPIDRRPSVALDVAPPASGAESAKGVVYVLTHVDVIPPGKDQAIGLVKELVAASRKDEGNLFYDALQQGNRANHMTLFAAWHDRADRSAYVTSDAAKEFRAKVTPLAGALYDERLYEAVR
ncbi:MAG: putative quinol monooxygenase [Stellaceae bacterium]